MSGFEELPERYQEIARAFERELEGWAQGAGVIGHGDVKRDQVALVVEQARRRGLPVIRGYVSDDGRSVLLDYVLPAGHG